MQYIGGGIVFIKDESLFNSILFQNSRFILFISLRLCATIATL